MNKTNAVQQTKTASTLLLAAIITIMVANRIVVSWSYWRMTRKWIEYNFLGSEDIPTII